MKDPRYHKQKWKQKSQFTRSLTRNRCCLCWREAKEVHHAYYGMRLLGSTLPIAGREIPGWQIFPLCDRHHSNAKGCAHNFDNYVVDRASNWRNRNTSAYLWRLRFGFLTTIAIANPIFFAVTGLILWCVWTTFATAFSASSFSPQFPPLQSDRHSQKKLLQKPTPNRLQNW